MAYLQYTAVRSGDDEPLHHPTSRSSDNPNLELYGNSGVLQYSDAYTIDRPKEHVYKGEYEKEADKFGYCHREGRFTSPISKFEGEKKERDEINARYRHEENMKRERDERIAKLNLETQHRDEQEKAKKKKSEDDSRKTTKMLLAMNTFNMTMLAVSN